MSDAPSPTQPDPGPAGVLSDDEIQALLGPGPAPGADPVLVLCSDPAEVALLEDRLRASNRPAVTAADRYEALDLFRARPYAGVVAAAEVLPPDPDWYLDRFREVDPAVHIAVLHDPGAEPPAGAAVAVSRPLTRDKVDLLVPPAGSPPPPPAPEEPAVPPGPAVPGRPPGLVQALLEARVRGEGVAEALRRWADAAPEVLGWAEMENGGGEWRVRARAGGQHPRRLVLRLLQALDGRDGHIDGPLAVGPFSLFPEQGPGRRYLALRLPDAGASRALVAGIGPLLPLLDRLAPASPRLGEGDARERFVALLGSRMRGVQRRRGRLALLVVEVPAGDEPGRVCSLLRSVLRGADWTESVGSRVYTILDEPDERVFAALGARLRTLPGIERFRVAALGWSPADGGDAAGLLARADRMLAAGGGVPGLAG